MTLVNLSQFASLFEIGFTLHFAVAFIDRIYARELPVRIERITARVKSIEQFKQEITEGQRWQEETGNDFELRLAYRNVKNPKWLKHNDQILERLNSLRQEAKGQMQALKSILSVITFLSVLVVLYSVTMLFMIGLEFDQVKGLEPMIASVAVLTQLLPLPIAASIFYFIARRMSKDVDRKIRSVGELHLMLNKPDITQINKYVSVDQVYRRDLT